MNVDNFKLLVSGFMNRDAGSFILNSIDCLLESINMAKLTAQRDQDFNVMKGRAFLVTNADGADFTTAATVTPGGIAVKVKRVRNAFTYSTTGGVYTRTAKFRWTTPESYEKDQLPSVATTSSVYSPITQQFIYVDGSKLFLTATAASTSLYLSSYNFLPDYVNGGAEDFFLDKGRDWMMLKTMQLLNFYLKEDQRVAISNSAVAAAWDSLLRYDNGLSNFDGANGLD
jgi:hypothetical protein